MKNFVVSDIHDHYDLLVDALNRNGFDMNRDDHRLIVYGHYSAARCYLMKDATQVDWENKIYKDVSDVPFDGFKVFSGIHLSRWIKA